MADCDIEQYVLRESAAGVGDFQASTVGQAGGLAHRECFEAHREDRESSRACTQSEMLQYLLELESSRNDLERYATRLSGLVDQAARASREAETAVRAKTEFLAMMTHEIRTPLNGIMGMTAVLLAQSLAEPERDCVETIRHSGEALLAIVDDLLDFSKIEARRLELECVEFEVAAVIREALQIVRGAAARKSIRISAQIDPALPKTVRGDIVRLRQILLNLLSNAIKFTPAGSIDLRAELQSTRDGSHELRFSVTDDGIGITEEQQAKLFEPFCQADVSTARKYGGTGLGLAICKRLTEMMGGTIGVESRFGEGSSFWFTIRVLAASTGDPRRAQAAANQTAPHNCRLLLVEDNSINQRVALLMLKKLGYETDLARNGVEAMQAIARQHYDLVLMDCLMPEMDGFEATRRIRSAGGRNAQLPIIAMTANAFEEDRKACFAAGMTDYLAKPFRAAELKSKLDVWLSAQLREPRQTSTTSL